MANIKFELNEEGVRELLKSDEMQSILDEYGSQKTAQAGDGYACEVKVHQKRAVAYIYPNTPEAEQDNFENNTLLKVIG